MVGPSLCLLKLKFLVFCEGFAYLFCEPFSFAFYFCYILFAFFFFLSFPLNPLRCKTIWFEAPCVNLQSKSVQSTDWSQLPLLDIGGKQSAEVLVLILTWY